jgi:hypothetical protein
MTTNGESKMALARLHAQTESGDHGLVPFWAPKSSPVGQPPSGTFGVGVQSLGH